MDAAVTNDLDALLPAELVNDLPEPHALKAVVKERIQEAYAVLHAARGEVLRPEDTYDLHRQLQATRERMEGYARGFTEVANLIGQLQQEELVEAVGEQDGVPLSGLTIPAAGGDIVVTPSFKRINDIDPERVQTAIVNGVTDAWVEPIEHAAVHSTETLEEGLREMLTQALAALVATGKWEPQVSKLKATAAQWARAGRDDMAGNLMAAHGVRQKFEDKVTVQRKTPQ
jgi:hypothetical protein